jgi:hypothetical protein
MHSEQPVNDSISEAEASMRDSRRQVIVFAVVPDRLTELCPENRSQNP